MADFKNLVTFPIDYMPGSASNIAKYRYPDNATWIGGTHGAQISSIAVDNGGDASTDSNGTGFGVSGNPYADNKSDSLMVSRYGQKDGRVVVRIGHLTKSSGGSTNFEDSIKGMHLYGVVGVSMVYDKRESSSGFGANLNRIMIQYSYKNGSYYSRRVYDATNKNTNSAGLGVYHSDGEKYYSYSIPDSEKSLVISNKMTCEGVYLEFKANKSPGCCKNKYITAQVWGLTPVIQSSTSAAPSTSAPSFVHCPVAYETSVKDAVARSGMLELATA